MSEEENKKLLDEYKEVRESIESFMNMLKEYEPNFEKYEEIILNLKKV